MSGYRLIAFDIDGTLTSHHREIPEDVLDYLHVLKQQGMELVFITGRTFSWAHAALEALKFPYYIAVQNGACILQMPEQKVLRRSYLPLETCAKLLRGPLSSTPFVIYSGYEYDDVCYQINTSISPQMATYLHERRHSIGETWHQVESVEDINLSQVASCKCFGTASSLLKAQKYVEESCQCSMPLIADCFNTAMCVGQITNQDVHKGKVLEFLRNTLHGIDEVIACGDDCNDITMLKEADVSIVMETAPKEVKQYANLIAPPASRSGIITALEEYL